MSSIFFLVYSICVVFIFECVNTTFGKPFATIEAEQNLICPKIVTREEWRARVVTNHQLLYISPTPYVVVHHGGIKHYCFNQNECSEIVRSYQNLHMDERGWVDIGYNFVIGEDGNVYEGRGWNFIGAHAPGYNTQSIGISIIGDFTKRLPNKAALTALNSLIKCGVTIGKIQRDYKLIGHRQARDTECPGTRFYEYIQKLPNWTNKLNPIYDRQQISNSTSN